MTHCNNKLKQAISLALALYALNAQQQALALGLGDIHVKSHLGEPLKATIKVVGADDLSAKDLASNLCFKLAGDPGSTYQISNANFSLSKVSGDEAILTVRTSEVINEPIANLSVIAECNGNIRRDYVLLMDPPLTKELNSSDATVEKVEQNEVAVPVAILTSTDADIKKPSKKQRQLAESTSNSSIKKHKKQFKNSQLEDKNNPDIVLHVPSGNEKTSPNTPEKNNMVANKPRLSVSGGSQESSVPKGVNLQMDRQLSVVADPNALPLDDIEMQDELTAMNNRFANLEKQIVNLQQKNSALSTENKLKAQQLTKAQAEKSELNWIGYVLGAALMLVAGSTALNWWRKRQADKMQESLKNWTSAEPNEFNLDENDAEPVIMASDNHLFTMEDMSQDIDIAVEKSTLKPLEFESLQNLSQQQVLEKEFVVEEQDFDSTVLDHADVFLSHGRTSLAIQLLQNHLLDYPKQSVTIWLFLLDLLSKEKMQAVFEQTALECKEHFNINIPVFSEDADETKDSLEAFPNLSEGLQQAWGTPAAIVYLDDLIYNNRLEPRTGFSKNLLEELLLLKSVAQQNHNVAEVIQLDDKKTALKEQKEALLAAKKAEKLQEINETIKLEQEKTQSTEKLYEFNLVEWK